MSVDGNDDDDRVYGVCNSLGPIQIWLKRCFCCLDWRVFSSVEARFSGVIFLSIIRVQSFCYLEFKTPCVLSRNVHLARNDVDGRNDKWKDGCGAGSHTEDTRWSVPRDRYTRRMYRPCSGLRSVQLARMQSLIEQRITSSVYTLSPLTVRHLTLSHPFPYLPLAD